MTQDYPHRRYVLEFLSFSLVCVFIHESDPEALPSNSLGLNTKIFLHWPFPESPTSVLVQDLDFNPTLSHWISIVLGGVERKRK